MRTRGRNISRPASWPISAAARAAGAARVDYPSTRLANVSELKADEPLDVVYPDADAPGVLLKLGKRVEVHVDQENNPYQNETELLCLKTIEHGMQGEVYGIHSISLACKDNSEQDRVIALLKQADVGVVICPSAALSMKQLPMTGPLHNSIAPFVKMKEAGVRTYLGIDNISDLFMPVVDGDMWLEARMLMEACRHYNLEEVADWACALPLHLEKAAAERVAAEADMSERMYA